MPRRYGLPEGFELVRGWLRVPQDIVPPEDWRQESVTVFGKTWPVPRMTAWYGTEAYTYSGIRHEATELPAKLEAMRRELEGCTGARFNSVLANLYRTGRDSVAWHSDDEPELGVEPVIASVSLGARRTFVIRTRDKADRWKVDLGHGDLLVMRGRSQIDYQHAVPKTAAPVGPRVNLTFRYIHASS